MCLLHIMNHILKQILRFFCLSVYFKCLVIWCFYFCIAVRLFKLFYHFAKNHPLLLLCVHHWWILILILRDGDIHRHPGPPRDLLKFMHWNLNSIVAHDGIRIPLIQSFNLDKKYDLIAITETALNDLTPDEKIQLDGYTPIRKDLPSGTTHGGVMFYHKDSLPVIRRPDLETQENSLVCEISLNIKKYRYSIIQASS